VITHCLCWGGIGGQKRCVSKLALFKAVISMVCLSSCSLNCFWLSLARFANSCFIVSDSWYRLRSLFLGCSADRGISSASDCAAGLLSSLLGVFWAAAIIFLSISSSGRTLP
jgi:hypothetical protein